MEFTVKEIEGRSREGNGERVALGEGLMVPPTTAVWEGCEEKVGFLGEREGVGVPLGVARRDTVGVGVPCRTENVATEVRVPSQPVKELIPLPEGFFTVADVEAVFVPAIKEELEALGLLLLAL